MMSELARAFGSAAELYDVLYSWKDYASESAEIRTLLDEEGLKWEARILEGACGSGRYLEHLAPHFEVAGFDLSGEMLAEARARLPKRTPLFQADLCDFELSLAAGQELPPFDVFLLLFGGLGYVPEERLADSLACISAALKPGGLFICEPWLSPDQFVPAKPHMLVVNRDELKLCRQVVTRREGKQSILDYWILVSRPGTEPQVLRDMNILTLYTSDELQSAFETAGFVVEQVRPGFMHERQIWICRKS